MISDHISPPLWFMFALYMVSSVTCLASAYQIYRLLGRHPMAFSLLGISMGSLSIAVFYFTLLVTDIEADIIHAIIFSRWMDVINGLATANAGIASFVIFSNAVKQRT